MEVMIRAERANDLEAITYVNKEAFGRDEEANLVSLLRSSDAFIPCLSLVAEAGEEIVGHILFTRIRIIDSLSRSTESLALAPVAVHSNYQKKGVGSALIREGLYRAREVGYLSAIVLGHENYYTRFGFAPASQWNISPPFEVPDECFMAVELVEHGLMNVSGIVVYAKEFEAA